MAIGLTYEFEFWASLKPPVQVGEGPLGNRVFFEVTGGEVSGERISGKVLTGGGDWLLAGADGVDRVDVRAQFETADGAFIYVQYLGFLETNEAVGQALQTGGGTDYGDHYFRTAPRLESGHERYAWVNRTLFVGEGRLREGGRVEYRVHRVD